MWRCLSLAKLSYIAMCVLVCREQIRANGPGVMGHALLQQETVVRRLFAPRKFIYLLGFLVPWKERRIRLEEGWLCHSSLDPLTCFPNWLWSFSYLELPRCSLDQFFLEIMTQYDPVLWSQFCPADVLPPQWQDPFTGVWSRLFPISDI